MPTFFEPQINLYVSDVERSLAFYTEHFGFRETFRFPKAGPLKHVEVRLDGLVLGLADVTAAIDDHGLPAVTSPHRVEICIKTNDVDAEFARLVAAGVPVIKPPHDFIGILRGAWFADPDGGPVQIYQDLPR